MPVQWRWFLPAGIPGSFQTRMLCPIYCETTIATWSLTFWRCLFSICCVWKLQLPSERMLMLSECLWLATKGWKTLWCARERATVVFVFILSGFCFVCAFVLSTFLLTFDVAWSVVGGHSLRHLEPANSRSIIQLDSLSSRVMPPWWGWHTLLESTLPSRSHEARNT